MMLTRWQSTETTNLGPRPGDECKVLCIDLGFTTDCGYSVRLLFADHMHMTEVRSMLLAEVDRLNERLPLGGKRHG